jgi:mannose-6-phosphate isomerase-like protein (cupin superfamily)
MERQQLSTVRAYKRSPALTNSTWYKGNLIRSHFKILLQGESPRKIRGRTTIMAFLRQFLSQMAGTADNNGAFDLTISKVRRGTEPPPHIHSREDEVFYVLSGEMRVYVGREVFPVAAGECMFLPRRKPHAFLITSEEVHMIAFVTPGGFLDTVNKMNAPEEQMEVPADVDTVTYANADLTDTTKVFEQHGVRFLTADEIHTQMPQYPL